MNETSKSNNELVLSAKNGDGAALTTLIGQFASLVRMRARSYAKGTLDEEDLFQEGMIALLSAVRNFRETESVSFKTFASVCVNHKLHNVLISHLRDKNAPMRAYISLDDTEMESEWSAVSPDDPAQMVIADEETVARREKIETLLSSFERQVLKLYLSSYSYEEMAKQLGSSAKAVDNALQRVRRKLRSSFIPEE